MLDFIASTLERSGHHDLQLLVTLLPFISIKHRKLLLQFCRVQNCDNKRLREEINAVCTDDVTSRFDYKGRPIHIKRVFDIIFQYSYQPLTLGFMSLIIRQQYHADETELERAIQQSLEKEFLAAVEYEKQPNMDWSCIFSDDMRFRDTPLSEFHPPSPSVAQKINANLCQYRDHLENVLPIIPTYSRTKNTSRSMARSFSSYSNSILPLSEIRTLDILKHYSVSGIRAGGHTEMRVAFRYTDLAPRSYYSTGGDAYWDAMYIKMIANGLCRTLPGCSPKDNIRYDISRLNYNPGDTVLLYDYSSFTSNLPAAQRFLRYVSGFFRGYYIRLWDPYIGIINQDIGELFERYNEALSVDLEFDMDRVWKIDDVQGEEDIFHMRKNGPLGAQGNINLSMFLHAISTTCALDSMDRANVIGDDAIVIFKEDYRLTRVKLMHIIGLIGSVNISKFIWMQWEPGMTDKDCEDAGWHFTKRPICVYQHYIWQGPLVTWPSLAIFLPPDPYHVSTSELDVQYKTLASQIGSFFDDCYRYCSDIQGEEMELCMEILKVVYHGASFPLYGSFPGRRIENTRVKVTIEYGIPMLTTDNFIVPWRRVLWDGLSGSVIGFSDAERSEDPYKMKIGSEEWSLCTKTRLLSAVEDFGYGEMRMARRFYFTGSYRDKELWLSPTARMVYEFRTNGLELPSSLYELCNAYNLEMIGPVLKEEM